MNRIFKTGLLRAVGAACLAVTVVAVLAGATGARAANGAADIATDAAMAEGLERQVPRRVLPSTGDLALPSPSASDAERDAAAERRIQPFGASLFEQQFLAARGQPINPEYRIQPGDQVAISIWGAWQFAGAPSVDLQGNVFIPEIGPVAVAGLRNQELDAAVRAAIRRVFSENVQSYTNLLTSQPVSVYVAGAVVLPGRYAGARTDSLLYYLSMAGGIDPNAGSYRAVTVQRDGREIARVDLYDFLINGRMPPVQFADNDVIVVAPQGSTVRVEGDVRRSHLFEVAPLVTTGAQIMTIAGAQPDASHVAVRGIRDGLPYNAYLPLAEFAHLPVNDGDAYRFESDRIDRTIFVRVEGHAAGPSSLALRRNARLRDALDLVEIDRDQADLSAIYLRRQSVALRQDRALEVSLQELQRTVLLTSSSGPTEAEIRVQEAELVERFISQVRAVKSEGRVVLADQPGALDLRLEAEDEIIIPQRSGVVVISGEVRVPQSILHAPGRSVAEYVQAAGGYTDRADRGKVVVLRQNGAAEIASSPELRPGDQVMVLPEAETKGLAIFRDVVEIMYRVAVSAGIVVRFWD